MRFGHMKTRVELANANYSEACFEMFKVWLRSKFSRKFTQSSTVAFLMLSMSPATLMGCTRVVAMLAGYILHGGSFQDVVVKTLGKQRDVFLDFVNTYYLQSCMQKLSKNFSQFHSWTVKPNQHYKYFFLDSFTFNNRKVVFSSLMWYNILYKPPIGL